MTQRWGPQILPLVLPGAVPGPVSGVGVWGAAARPGAGPLRVPGLVPARGQRGRSNGPLFPAGTQRAPVRPSQGWGGGGTAAWGGCGTCPRSWGALQGWPEVGCQAAEPVTTICGSTRARGAHPPRGSLPPARTPPECPAGGLGGEWPCRVLWRVSVPLLGVRWHGAGIIPAAGPSPDGEAKSCPPPVWLVPGCYGKPVGFPWRWADPLAVAWETVAVAMHPPPRPGSSGVDGEGTARGGDLG